MFELLMIPVLFFAVAALYASVGHAGASGYLAVMTLAVGLSEKTAGPTALVLNLIVASLSTLQFQRAHLIPWRNLLPYVIGSIPLAWYGGRLALDDKAYTTIVGVLLLAASVRLLFGTLPTRVIRQPHFVLAIFVGVVIGLLAGLTRTGGGIFLTPLLLLMGWAKPKEAAGMSVAFILVNSAAGLSGRLMQGGIVIPDAAVTWGIAAALGGLLGSWYGARKSGLIALRRLLAVVLLLAGAKLLIPDAWLKSFL